MTDKKQETSTFETFMDHQMKAVEEAIKAVESLIPPDFREHGQAAVNESATGFRVLFNGVLDDIKTNVDQTIDSLKRDEAKHAEKGKVRVEVS